jgi:hypothetical protein
MKGMVFTEFFELVDEQFSMETSERLIEMSDLPSLGVYTSVGTYDRREMVALVSNLSTLTGVPVSDLLKAFGRHLFYRFTIKFPEFFEGVGSTIEFLPRVEDVVHLEVRKLYADAELPTFSCTAPRPGTMVMVYRSQTNLPDLAEGLLLACIEHFGEPLKISREDRTGDLPETIFTIAPK